MREEIKKREWRKKSGMKDSAERGLSFINSGRVNWREMMKLSAIPKAPLPNSLNHHRRACHKAYGFGSFESLAAVTIRYIHRNSKIMDLS